VDDNRVRGDGAFARRDFLSLVAILASAGIATDWLFDTEPAAANGAWGGYSNGNIPLSALVQINYPGVVPFHYSNDALPYVYMAPGAAERLLLMLAAYHNAFGGYLRVSEGYRTYAAQVWLANNGNPPRGGTPGQSNHGWGQAVDFDYGLLTTTQANWLNANGPSWEFHDLSGDYGHYNYTGPLGPPLLTQEDPMAIMFYAPVGGVNTWAMAGAGQGTAAWWETTDEVLAGKLATYINGKASVGLTVAQWNDIKARFTAAPNVHTV
jgi:hypothetical protein